ncbi:MAG: tRNA preQ1(34) S-adenosylmethionine ribosyltransferase-isomerase QueA [Deltaproteobacteria bacterium]|jgi:S-adenosylmethionine:tRNA ribosyltransferase-isomerase|nr:tRNA preQ1(34) S-adenosylmethionine ribosyltransferase-isomerase QueA [Deltaproteobacteria bacterium]
MMDFYLPPELIAQEPPQERGDSRLLVFYRSTGRIVLTKFAELGQYLPPDSVLVLNEAKVTPARLLGSRRNGGQAEALILSLPTPGAGAGVYDLEALVKPGKHIQPGQILTFSNEEFNLTGEVIAVRPNGQRLIRFNFPKPPLEALESLGHVPLPPYIKRPDRASDRERYQTVYAQKPGAVAAPTAGLHFTKELLADLEKKGARLVKIFLKVGAGTFAPLTDENIKSGTLQAEEYEISQETIEVIAAAKAKGENVAAVGSTSVKTLEWAALGEGGLKAGSGQTSLFIRPGFQFKVVDSLITNFHLPGTSLLLLVAALTGEELLKKAYARAIEEEFRFYSYGDAMLIL